MRRDEHPSFSDLKPLERFAVLAKNETSSERKIEKEIFDGTKLLSRPRKTEDDKNVKLLIPKTAEINWGQFKSAGKYGKWGVVCGHNVEFIQLINFRSNGRFAFKSSRVSFRASVCGGPVWEVASKGPPRRMSAEGTWSKNGRRVGTLDAFRIRKLDYLKLKFDRKYKFYTFSSSLFI